MVRSRGDDAMGSVVSGWIGGSYAQGDLVALEERAALETQVPKWRERFQWVHGVFERIHRALRECGGQLKGRC